MTNLFNTINHLVPTLHGWATPAKSITLASAVLALRPDIIVEVGVWGGKSLFPMALACKEIGKGTVIGVDPWSPAASVQGQTLENQKWWSEQPHEVVYRDFLQKRGELGLNEIVKVERMTSDYFDPPKRIGLCHLDGNHGPQAAKDAEKFGPLVQIGGLLFLDDVNWSEGHVMRAKAHLNAIGFVDLFALDTGVMMQRISRV